VPGHVPDQPTRDGARVLVIDDHAVVRRGLALLISQQPGLCACGEAGTPAEALEAVKTLRPDVAVVDIALGGADGLALIAQIKAQWPEVRVLALSMHSDTLYAERAVRAGASGYLMKEQAVDVLVTALRQVAEGGVYLSDEAQARLVRRMSYGGPGGDRTAIDTLSDRELAVFRQLGSGFTTRQISTELHLSQKTIQSHVEHMKRKLSLASATALVRYATLWMEHAQGG